MDSSKESQVIKNSLEHELGLIEHSIEKTRSRLKDFEKKFKMSFREFCDKYEEGEMGDSQETMLWAAEFESLKHLEQDKEAVLRMLDMWKT